MSESERVRREKVKGRRFKGRGSIETNLALKGAIPTGGGEQGLCCQSPKALQPGLIGVHFVHQRFSLRAAPLFGTLCEALRLSDLHGERRLLDGSPSTMTPSMSSDLLRCRR